MEKGRLEMRIGKQYLGQVVELEWVDPTFSRTVTSKLPRGKLALASWKEYGKVFDVTDGVVIIAHSIGKEPLDPDDDVCYTAIPEEIVLGITILEVKDGHPKSDTP